jgi:glutamate--cysteine ligase
VSVPHITTALTGDVPELERKILNAMPSIEDWLQTKWQDYATPFYASVDLRNSGFKLAPVDTNLYPGGFNNLNTTFDALCQQAVVAAIQKNCADARRVLLIPENHTRNVGYMENVGALQRILLSAGMDVRIGSLLPDLAAPMDIELRSGAKLTLEPLARNGHRIGVSNFDPCLVLLNNDLSSGLPEILRDLEQAVLPPLHAGWFMRRKSNHFAAYNEIAAEFAQLIGIDPWLINPFFGKCGKINFTERIGEECLESYVAELLDGIRDKYAEYGIKQEPFVIAKADSGTYGMAIMTVKDPAEITNLNRRDRTSKMERRQGTCGKVHESAGAGRRLYMHGMGQRAHCCRSVGLHESINPSSAPSYLLRNAARGDDSDTYNTPGGSWFETTRFRKRCGFVLTQTPGAPRRNRFYGLPASSARPSTLISARVVEIVSAHIESFGSRPDRFRPTRCAALFFLTAHHR